MLGYVFIVENLETHKKFIGKNLSVYFDAEYYGDNKDLTDDIIRYGKDRFRVKMLNACDDPKAVEAVYRAYINEYNAISDKSFYNCPGETPGVQDAIVTHRKTRKRKNESLS